VVVEQVAVGRQAGEISLHINVANPTVSTASRDMMMAAADADGWRGQRWTRTMAVPVVTLDELVARHGEPAFIKIDVEGFEAEALEGLSRPSRALSFEFTTIQRPVALAALARCAALGYRRFNAALGESQRLEHDEWIGADTMREWLSALSLRANSGDIYAMLS
jgi:hypothetical protein